MKAVVPLTDKPKKGLRRLIPVILGLPAGVWMLVVFLRGRDYYALPRVDRPFHPLHDLLRPAGFMGLWFGIVAATLLVLNLGYLIRKRLLHLRHLGSLHAWIDFHMTSGIVACALVTFHAAFAPYSPLGMLALIALLITVLTGLIGRYVYAHVPRSMEGRELEIEQVRERLESCREQLERAGVDSRWLHIGKVPDPHREPLGLLRSFASLIIGDQQQRRDYRELRRAVLSAKELRPMARQILPLARNFCRHWQWMVRYHEWRDLLSSWRFLHRWLAIVMLIVAALHICLAFRYADLSVLGGAP